MSKLEFLQELKAELEGRIPHSIIQEDLRHYDSYVTEETAKGHTEEGVIEGLGGLKIVARTIVDAASDTEDRPDGFDTYGSGAAYDEGTGGGYAQRESQDPYHKDPKFHYVDFGKWHVRLVAGLVISSFILLIMTVFFGIMGLTGWILSYIWSIPPVMVVVWMFRGSYGQGAVPEKGQPWQRYPAVIISSCS